MALQNDLTKPSLQLGSSISAFPTALGVGLVSEMLVRCWGVACIIELNTLGLHLQPLCLRTEGGNMNAGAESL